MDVRMPGIDGLKATKIIRDELNIRESEMPVICISAFSANEDWQKYRKAGMNTFLPKPFTEEILLTTIISALKDYGPVKIPDKIIDEKPGFVVRDKINLKNLFHLSGGDEHFVRQMLMSFIETSEKGLRDMQESMISGEMEMVADIAHKMLPPCRHIQASDMCNLLKNIEDSIHHKADRELIEKLILESVREFEIIRGFIKQYMDKIS
jgi:HPt (histidine-containing phosphotransfer) domain-containing protein